MTRNPTVIPGKCLLLIFTFSLILFSSCEKEFSCENCLPDHPVSNPPIANAGSDQVILLPEDSALLNGSASSDPDGTITTIIWTRISGSSATILNSGSLITIVKNLTEGIYHFELKLTDNDGLEGKDTVRVMVDNPSQNQPPVANAGADQSITLPANSVNLNGSNSYDPDNNISHYQWTKIIGPSTLSISNSTSIQTQVTNLVQGTYYFQLVVTDANGLFSKDTVEIRVELPVQSNCIFQKTLVASTDFNIWGYQSVLAGNKIIIAGGFEHSTSTGTYPSGRVAILDLPTQTWTNYTLDHGGNLAIIAYGDKVFIAGGTQANSNNIPSSSVDIYNTTNNSWTGSQLSEARSGLAAVNAGNKILFSGGIVGNVSSTRIDIYDIASGTWTFTSLAHYIGNSGSSNGIAVFAGSPTGIDIYNPSANSWSISMHSMDQYAMTLSSTGTKFFFAGGFHAINFGYKYSDRVHIYDHASATWTQTNLSQPRAEAKSMAAGNKIFWFGGYDSTWIEGTEQHIRTVTDIETYDVNSGTRSHHYWNGNGHHAGRTNNYALFYDYSANLLMYNLNAEIWTSCNIDLGTAPVFLWAGNTTYAICTTGANPASVKVWKLDF